MVHDLRSAFFVAIRGTKLVHFEKVDKKGALVYSTYWKTLSAEKKKNLALKAKTSVGYLRMIMRGQKKAGFKITLHLHELTNGEVNKSVLRPDIYPVEVEV